MKNTQTLSRHRISLLRQRKLEVVVNIVATKTTIVATESEENDKKIVATQKWMLRLNIELKVYISIVTKENYVMTISKVRDFCRDRKWKISARSFLF